MRCVIDIKIGRFRPDLRIKRVQVTTGSPPDAPRSKVHLGCERGEQVVPGMDVAHEKTRPLASERTGWCVSSVQSRRLSVTTPRAW